MNSYKVTITCTRWKILLIKLFRCIKQTGLGDTKLFVEENFCFDEWMDADVKFQVTVFEDQLGRMTNLVTGDDRIHITKCVALPYPTVVDPLDFTH